MAIDQPVDLSAQSSDGSRLSERRGAATRGLFAFTHVNVVALTSDTVTRDVTVLIREGRIVDIGRGVVVPTGAQRFDGRGRYLMPGLSDMHTLVLGPVAGRCRRPRRVGCDAR